MSAYTTWNGRKCKNNCTVSVSMRVATHQWLDREIVELSHDPEVIAISSSLLVLLGCMDFDEIICLSTTPQPRSR
jgi:hypothetical protein